MTDSFLSDEFLSKYEGVQPRNKGILFEPVFYRTYSRYIPEKKRRETWLETIKRVTNYNVGLYQGPAERKDLIKEAELMFDKLFNLEVLPSGRSLWVGGTKAIEKCPEMAFNCSALVITKLEDFCDIFHLLMCGCGVGYRILKDDVASLPKLNTNFKTSHYEYIPKPVEQRIKRTYTVHEGVSNLIMVGDSREDWVEALRTFLNLLTETDDIIEISFNYNSVRPAGERIKTSGGIAPGPFGLRDMFISLERTIKEANGVFTPVLAMDIANMIAKNVIVGGTRRSAQIALGSPDDIEFVEAKKDLYHKLEGKWIRNELKEHRTMSNNSVVFKSKPTLEEIKKVFSNIRNNGEPGFFNLISALKRRPKANTANPCLTKDAWVMTDLGPRQVCDLIGTQFHAFIDNNSRHSSGFFKTGTKDVYELNTVEGYNVKVTNNHKILTKLGKDYRWKEAKDLVPGESIVLNNNRSISNWSGEGSFKEGWLVGNFIGDGNFNTEHHSSSILQYWGEHKDYMSRQAKSYLEETTERVKNCKQVIGVAERTQSGSLAISSVRVTNLVKEWGLSYGNKVQITPKIEKSSFDFYRGFLQGLFDADGCPQGCKLKGFTVRLSQSNKPFLQGVQRMLSHMGITSTIPTVRHKSGMRMMPDGKGGYKEYMCQSTYELIISRDSMVLFNKVVGFSKPDKKKKLQDYVDSLVKTPYRSKFEATFKSLDFVGIDDVYDCNVSTVHRFDANGIIVHNCMEILLDNYGVCNLSTVILPSHVKDGKIDFIRLYESVSLATRIGLRQTNVSISLPHWDATQKRDRLTGVSMTGLMDVVDQGINNQDLKNLLIIMREYANITADRYSFEMRIPRPLLVTCLKPEGSLSLLPTVSPGMHRSYAPYYIRRIRVSELDPVCKALQHLGVPNERDITKKNSSRIVFSFPIKSNAKIKANDEPTASQFERYLILQKNYTDHNTSCTITVGDDEWEEISEKVHENWDDVVACAFLPKEEGTYPQMPLESITEEQYNELMINFPDLSQLSSIVNKFENNEPLDDLELVDCTTGSCPIR